MLPVVPYPAHSEHRSGIALENMLGCSPGKVMNVLGSGVGWSTVGRFLFSTNHNISLKTMNVGSRGQIVYCPLQQLWTV